jgi:predicted nuclease of restriction endonuclease-like RecB superfamily
MTGPFHRGYGKSPIKRKVHEYKGQKMASKGEVELAKWMDQNKIFWMYEPEVFRYVLPGRRYTPDFKVERKDGSFFYVEFKGWLRPEDRTKMIAFHKSNPEVDIRFVFANAEKTITKTSKTTYGQWAAKHGFIYAHGTIPARWLEERSEDE